ncbi:Tripartite ATP-independent periplasmic transporter, DctQ component [compost metagenome]
MKFGVAAALRLAGRIDAINRQMASVVRWGLLANAILIAGNAFSRKLLGVASSSMYDVQPHFFAAVVLLMAAFTLQRDEHVRIDVFSGSLGPRGMAWLDLVGILVVLLPLCVVAVWVTAPEFARAFASGETRGSRESLSTFPAWIMKGMIPLGFLSLGAQGIAEAARCIAFLAGIIPARRETQATKQGDPA